MINQTLTNVTANFWALTQQVVAIRYCRDRVSSCNIYAVQQDTQSVLMSEFIQHLC